MSKFNKVIWAIFIISVIALIVLFNLYTPNDAGPVIVLLVFSFIYLSIMSIFTYIIHLFSRVVKFMFSIVKSSKPIDELSMKYASYYAVVVSAVSVMFIGLQSVGAISLYSILLILLFGIIGCFYISKRLY